MTKREKWILGLLLGLGLVLRLYRIGQQSLWVDEIYTLSVSDPKPGLGIWDYLKYNIHGPAHSFVVYLFHLVSMSDGWLRLPSAIAGTLAIFYFFKWLSLLLSTRTALIAGALMAINPMLIYYSQEVRNYSFLVLFGMLSNYLFHRYREQNRVSVLPAYCISMALAALSNFAAAFLFAVHTIMHLVKHRLGGRALLAWLLVGLVVLILISPWVYRIYRVIDFSKLVTPVAPGQLSEFERLRGETTVVPSAVPYALYTFSVGFSLGPSLRYLHYNPSLGKVLAEHGSWVSIVALFFGCAALLGAMRSIRSGLYFWELSLYLWVPVVLTLLLCWQNAKAFNARYVILSLPAFLAFVVLGIDGAGKVWMKLFLALGIIVPTVASLGNYYYRDEYAKEDVRGAVHSVRERLQADECVFAPTVNEVVQHYLGPEREVLSLYSPPGMPRAKVEESLSRTLAGCRKLWYIEARPWAHDWAGYVLDYLDREYSSTAALEFPGVRVMRYVRKH